MMTMMMMYIVHNNTRRGDNTRLILLSVITVSAYICTVGVYIINEYVRNVSTMYITLIGIRRRFYVQPN